MTKFDDTSSKKRDCATRILLGAMFIDFGYILGCPGEAKIAKKLKNNDAKKEVKARGEKITKKGVEPICPAECGGPGGGL